MSKESGEGQYHYASAYDLGGRPLSLVSERVYSGLSLTEEGAILDLGGGSGRIPMNAPRPRSAHFLVIDVNSTAIDQCRAAILLDGRMDEAVVGDITNLTALSAVQNRQFRGAVSWRVIHALTPSQQLQVLDQARQILPFGAPLFLAVASDLDWKARELKARGIYVPDAPNDCREVMSLPDPFVIHFFHPDRLEQLAITAGFRVEEMERFQEPTGFDHLRGSHPLNNYLYAHLVRV